MAKLLTNINTSCIPAQIHALYQARARAEERKHFSLGPSAIGYSCLRRIWYGVRWCPQDGHEGRIYRLFDTGKLEEARVIADLRAIGLLVYGDDPQTGEQFRVAERQVAKDEESHFAGWLDGACFGVPEAPKTWHLLEIKTHSKWSFGELVKKGVEKAKPEHYAQCLAGMCLARPRFKRALYVAVCKDSDDIYVERIRWTKAESKALRVKAVEILQAESPPERISTSADSWDCKFCSHRGFCHQLPGAPDRPEVNCRTCLHSTAVVGGGWDCAKHEIDGISKELQAKGCDKHLFIPGLLPWMQLDATENCVSYKSQINGAVIYNHEGGLIDEIPF